MQGTAKPSKIPCAGWNNPLSFVTVNPLSSCSITATAEQVTTAALPCGRLRAAGDPRAPSPWAARGEVTNCCGADESDGLPSPRTVA